MAALASGDLSQLSRSRIMEISLAPLQRVYLWGQAELLVVKGQVQLNGYLARADTNARHRLVSPLSSSLLYFENISPDETAVVQLFDLCDGLENIKFSSGVPLLFPQLPPGKTFTLDTQTTGNAMLMDIPEEWWNSAAKILSSSDGCMEVVVCGPRKVGKSTFSRFLTNHLLNTHPKVAYIDLDSGQTEFTPPGMISLTLITSPILGPPFANLRLCEHQMHVGYLSPSEGPLYFSGCIRKLREIYEEKYRNQKIPLVVNLLGWTTGLGLSILQMVLQAFRPLNVVAFDTDLPAANVNSSVPEYLNEALYKPFPGFRGVAAPFSPEDPINIIPLGPSKASGSEGDRGRIKAVELRHLATTSYFFADWTPTQDLTKFDFSRPLWERRPYELPWRDVQIYVPSCIDPVSGFEALFKSLNCSFVGLATDRGKCPTTSLNLKWVRGRDDDIPECVGMAFIRSIDTLRQVFQVLTPVPLRMLQEKNAYTFVLSKNLPPGRLMQINIPSTHESLPYMSAVGSFSGPAKNTRRTRNNILRRNQQ